MDVQRQERRPKDVLRELERTAQRGEKSAKLVLAKESVDSSTTMPRRIHPVDLLP